jgi:hypothetical protein
MPEVKMSPEEYLALGDPDFDIGRVSSGTYNSLTDVSKAWSTNQRQGSLLNILVDGKRYQTVVTSNTGTTLYFVPIAVIVKAESLYMVKAESISGIQGNATGFQSNMLGAFGRLRVANPDTLGDYQLQYSISPLMWNQKTVGAATITFLSKEAAGSLNVTTASGDRAVLQTKRYHRYQPGNSQKIDTTGVFGAATAGCIQRQGYFDDYNGVFFQLNGSTLSVVQRSSTTGSVVDTVVNQAQWNLDTMDGNGPSGIKIDITRAQIFSIDLQWLGVGRVRLGFNVGGILVYCHEFDNANYLTSAYMETANLPVRKEILNTTDTANSVSMKTICATVICEGGFNAQRGFSHSANNGTTTIGVTTRRPILSIQPKLTYFGLVNRALILLQSFYLDNNTGSDDVLWELVYNGTLTGASFNSAATRALINFDVAATAITGGDVIASGYLPRANRNVESVSLSEVFRDIPLTLDIDGANPDTVSIVCTSFGVVQQLASSLTVKEYDD